MDFKMFLEFPGVLVIFGVLLIVIAIVIALLSNKKDKKAVVDEKNLEVTNEYKVEPMSLTDNEELEEKVALAKQEPIDLIKDNMVVDGTVEAEDDFLDEKKDLQEKEENVQAPEVEIVKDVDDEVL